MRNIAHGLEDVSKTRQVILTVSRHCNLSCRYCYESYKSHGKMTFATATRVLEDEFRRSAVDKVTEAVNVSFMGGEPLDNFELIQQVSEWMWSKTWPLSYTLSLQTNGTLLNDAMRAWFVANKERMDVGLSFDGLGRVNAINRTDQWVDVDFFVHTWPHKRVTAVLFKDTVGCLAENVVSMNNARIPFLMTFGDGFEWTERDVSVYEQQMGLLLPEYMDTPKEARECGLFSLSLVNFFPGNLLEQTPFCGVVDNIVDYDVDGESYICHIFAPLTLGQEKAKQAKAICCDLKMVPWDPECDRCPLRNTCKPCFGFHFKLFGDVNRWSSKSTICRLQKAKAKACAVFHLKWVEKEMLASRSLSDDDLMAAEKAVRYLEWFSEK